MAWFFALPYVFSTFAIQLRQTNYRNIVKKFIIRAISGILYGVLIIASLVIDNELLFDILFGLIAVLGIHEFNHLMSAEGRNIEKSLDAVGGLLLFLVPVIWVIGGSTLGIGLYLAYLVARLVVQLYIKQGNPLTSLSASLMGQVYVALPLSILSSLYHFVGQYMVLAMFAFIWISDTGAYMVGCLIGKHRLFERISPKKSWEGFFGGLGLSIIIAALAARFIPDGYVLLSGYAQWIVFAVLVTIFSTWGDLCESLIKRTVGVKDSGKLIPVHGGILDRIDSLLLVSLAVGALILMII